MSLILLKQREAMAEKYGKAFYAKKIGFLTESEKWM